MPDTAVIDGHSVRRSILINAPRSSVWSAITEPDRISEWFGDTTDLSPVAVGTIGSFSWEGYGSFPVEVTSVDPVELFAYRWANEPNGKLGPDSSTLVTFTLEEVEGGTRLTVVETGFDALAGGTSYRRRRLEENRDGWNSELDELSALFA